MDLQQLRYIKALVEEGTFAGAAIRCAVPKPMLSEAIAQLEAECGRRLFRRTTKKTVRLTPYGESLFPAVLEVLRTFESLTALSKCTPVRTSGGIHIGLSPIVGIQRAEAMLSRFRIKHPETELIYRESNFRDLRVLLQRRQLDIVISPCDMSLSLEPGYLTISLEKDPLVFIPKFQERPLWQRADNVTLTDIANETFVMVPDACGLTSCVKSLFEANNLVLRRHASEASSYTGIQEWAQLGLGAGILPKSRLQGEGTFTRPIVHNGHPVTIEYYALGKPTATSSQLFSQLWDSLLEVKIILRQASLSAAATPDNQLRLI